jgi:hypothetical protein
MAEKRQPETHNLSAKINQFSWRHDQALVFTYNYSVGVWSIKS